MRREMKKRDRFKLVKRCAAVLLTLGILTGSFGLQSGAAAAGNGTATPNVILESKQQGTDIWKEIGEDSKVSLSDDFRLKLEWDKLEEIELDQPYTFNLPEQMQKFPDDSEKELNIKIKYNGELKTCNFGTINLKKDTKEFTVTFHELKNSSTNTPAFDYKADPDAPKTKDLKNSYVYVSCGLDGDKLGADDRGEVAIVLPGGREVCFIVTEMVPKGPSLSKSVEENMQASDLQGTVKWKIKYTTQSHGYKGKLPNALLDTLPEGTQFVTGSLVSSPDASVNAVPGEAGQTLKITGLENLEPATEYTFTYKTKLTDKKIWTVMGQKNHAGDMKNSVETQSSEAGYEPLKAAATAKFPEKWDGFSVINKTGTALGNQINWTITVRAFSQIYKKLTVHDTLGNALSYKSGTLEVNGSPLSEDQYFSVGKELTIPLISSQGKAEDVYTITYSTEIEQDYFDHTKEYPDGGVKNNARLEWEFPEGAGPGTNLHPEISKGPGDVQGLKNNMIGKSVGDYAPKTHSLPWTITVNPQNVDLTEATLTDDLSTANHLFVEPKKDSETQEEYEAREEAAKNKIKGLIEAALADAGLASGSLIDIQLTNNKLTARFQNIGKKSFSFSVDTFVKDPVNWAGNASKIKYKNTAKITAAKVGGIPVKGTPAASVEKEVSVETLKKAHTEYDPSTKCITWKFEVNNGQTRLGNVKIEDTLNSALEYVSGSEQLDRGNFTGANTFKAEGQNISVSLNNVQGKHTITFQTKVNLDMESVREKNVIEIGNRVSMTSDANKAPVTSYSDFKLQNNALEKNGARISDSTQVQYTVKLNPLGIDLLGGQGKNRELWLKDTLDPGLVIDLETVEVYKAEAESRLNNGIYMTSLVKKEKINLNDKDLKFDPAQNSFQIRVPDSSQAYIVTYNAYVTRTEVELKNHVQLLGSIMPEENNMNSSQHKYQLGSFGSAEWRPKAANFYNLEICKQDKNGVMITGDKVKDTSFELYTDAGGNDLLTSGKCDKGTGKCLISLPKSVMRMYDGQKLYLKETNPPNGYEPLPTLIEFTVDLAQSPQVIRVSNVQSGDHDKASIKIKKTDEQDGQALEGAEFGLYTDSTCVEDKKVAQGTTADDGMLTFNGLYPGATYYLKENRAPEGYVLQAEPIPVKAAETAELMEIKNEKAVAGIRVIKVDQEDHSEKLEGAKFGLYTDPETKVPVKKQEVQTTDGNGEVIYRNLLPNTTYYLKELKAPDGYCLREAAILVKTGENISDPVEIFAENEKVKTDSQDVPFWPDVEPDDENLLGEEQNHSLTVENKTNKNETVEESSKKESLRVPRAGDKKDRIAVFAVVMAALGVMISLGFKKKRQ